MSTVLAGQPKELFCIHCGARVATCRRTDGGEVPIAHACSDGAPCPFVAESHGPFCLWAKSIGIFAEEDAE